MDLAEYQLAPTHRIIVLSHEGGKTKKHSSIVLFDFTVQLTCQLEE